MNYEQMCIVRGCGKDTVLRVADISYCRLHGAQAIDRLVGTSKVFTVETVQ